jgi:opacity protein-like surface antigen
MILMRKKVLFILGMLYISALMFAQYGFNLNMYQPEIIDGRAEALGRTSILTSSGANYLFNNPSKLSEIDQKNLQLSCRAVLGNSEFKETEEDEDPTNITHKFPMHFRANGFSFALPYDLTANKEFKTALAVGYRTYYDWGYNIKVKYENEDDEFEIDVTSRGGFSTLVFGGGFCYQGNLLGGISISVPFMSDMSNEVEDNEGYRSKDDGTMKGTFITWSGTYILNDKITFGARLRTAFDLEIEWDDDEGYSSQYDLSIPSELGLAIELKTESDLKLYAEYVSMGLGDFELESINGNIENNDSENGYSFHSGIEKGTKNVFRAGFFLQSVPIYELLEDDHYYYEDTIYDDTPLTETGFTVGLGLQPSPSYTLDVFGSYSYLNYDENYEDSGDDLHTNDYSFSRMKFGCSVGYKFN